MKNKSHWAKDRKIKRHQKEQYNFLRLVSHIFLVVFLIILVYVMVYSKFFKINAISIHGVKTLEYEKVEEVLSDFLKERFFGIVPRSNFLFLTEDSVSDLLTQEFKKVKKVRIEKKYPDDIGVYLTERDSLLLWCLSSGCYMIDEDGRAYEKVGNESLSVSEDDLIRLQDISNKDVSEGDYVLKSEYTDFVLSVKNELWNNFGLCVSNEFSTSSRLAEEVIIEVVDGWDLYLDSTIPIEKSINTLKLFFDESMNTDELVDLEYVDLRIEDKIFYKLVGDDGGDAENEEVTEDEIFEKDSTVVADDIEVEGNDEVEKDKKDKNKDKD